MLNNNTNATTSVRASRSADGAPARMCVVDSRTNLGHLKESHLPFEGFLEVHATSAAACGTALTRAVARTTMLCAGTLTITCTPCAPR